MQGGEWEKRKTTTFVSYRFLHAASITTSLTFKTKKIFRSLLLLEIRLVFAAFEQIVSDCKCECVCLNERESENLLSLFSLDSRYQCENLLLTPSKYAWSISWFSFAVLWIRAFRFKMDLCFGVFVCRCVFVCVCVCVRVFKCAWNVRSQLRQRIFERLPWSSSSRSSNNQPTTTIEWLRYAICSEQRMPASACSTTFEKGDCHNTKYFTMSFGIWHSAATPYSLFLSSTPFVRPQALGCFIFYRVPILNRFILYSYAVLLLLSFHLFSPMVRSISQHHK